MQIYQIQAGHEDVFKLGCNRATKQEKPKQGTEAKLETNNEPESEKLFAEEEDENNKPEIATVFIEDTSSTVYLYKDKDYYIKFKNEADWSSFHASTKKSLVVVSLPKHLFSQCLSDGLLIEVADNSAKNSAGDHSAQVAESKKANQKANQKDKQQDDGTDAYYLTLQAPKHVNLSSETEIIRQVVHAEKATLNANLPEFWEGKNLKLIVAFKDKIAARFKDSKKDSDEDIDKLFNTKKAQSTNSDINKLLTSCTGTESQTYFADTNFGRKFLMFYLKVFIYIERGNSQKLKEYMNEMVEGIKGIKIARITFGDKIKTISSSVQQMLANGMSELSGNEPHRIHSSQSNGSFGEKLALLFPDPMWIRSAILCYAPFAAAKTQAESKVEVKESATPQKTSQDGEKVKKQKAQVLQIIQEYTQNAQTKTYGFTALVHDWNLSSVKLVTASMFESILQDAHTTDELKNLLIALKICNQWMQHVYKPEQEDSEFSGKIDKLVSKLATWDIEYPEQAIVQTAQLTV